MVDKSSVQIIYDESVDITNHCVITGASFESASNARPGTAEMSLRDMDRDLSFVTGRRLQMLIDGQQMWSGFSLINGRSNFFPAGDGREATKSRRWVLRGTDNNLLLDKRVLRNASAFLSAIPNVTSDEYDGATLRRALATYSDMPTADPWLDISSEVDDVALLSTETGQAITATFDSSVPQGPWAYPQQGSKLRQTFDALAQISGAVYYIGPDDKVHYHAIQDRESPWGFSDRPNKAPITGSGGFEGAYWGFRELSADEDGTEFATDALVWGGSEFAGSGGTVFHRATDASLEAIHNKWQYAETHFGEKNYKLQAGVDIRANMIVFGNPTGTGGGSAPGSVPGEGPRGLRFPQWSYGFTWHVSDVPTIAGVPRHIYPGDLVPIQLWGFSEDDGATPFTKILPLRQLRITFPSGARDGKAIVRFTGTFDLRNQDSKFLWGYLRRRNETVSSIALANVDDSSTSAPYGGYGQFTPTPSPDGATTAFTIPFGYIAGTAQVFLNGLIQRPGVDYVETDPEGGVITFTSAPLSTDSIIVTCRTQAG